MATFDATRPIVAASAIGVARAALDFVQGDARRARRASPLRRSAHRLTALERDVMEMEAQVQAARLLTLAGGLDDGQRACATTSRPRWPRRRRASSSPGSPRRRSSSSGPLGYSRQLLLEKWMRDAKISDIYEGTEQINQLIIARRILGYSSKQLR